MVDEVSNVTRLNWNQVWEMNLIEFLNICCYSRDKNNWEKAQQEKWRRAH